MEPCKLAQFTNSTMSPKIQCRGQQRSAQAENKVQHGLRRVWRYPGCTRNQNWLEKLDAWFDFVASGLG